MNAKNTSERLIFVDKYTAIKRINMLSVKDCGKHSVSEWDVKKQQQEVTFRRISNFVSFYISKRWK